MVDYLLDWLHNILVMVATLSGIGLLGYVVLRSFYPATLDEIEQTLRGAAYWISGINLWPVVAIMLLFAIAAFTLPARGDHI